MPLAERMARIKVQINSCEPEKATWLREKARPLLAKLTSLSKPEVLEGLVAGKEDEGKLLRRHCFDH